MNMQIGAGYHPSFQAGGASLLPLAGDISLVELGLAELRDWSNASPKTPVSLHLSRSPITEDPETQDAFIRHLESENRLEKYFFPGEGVFYSHVKDKGYAVDEWKPLPV